MTTLMCVIGAFLVSVVASSAVLEALSHVAALAADDECGATSIETGGQCAVNALQVRSSLEVAVVAVEEAKPEWLREGKDASVVAAVTAEAPKVIKEVISMATVAATAGGVLGMALQVGDGEKKEGSTSEGASEEEGGPADTFPDLSTGLDQAGPYDEVPDQADAANPKPSKEGWLEQAKDLGAAWGAYGSSFCSSHQTGYFCDGDTRMRCCKQDLGYVKCGSTWHASSCGYGAGSGGMGGGMDPGYSVGGGSYQIHPGWRQSDFCASHHVGFFCHQQHQVQCCSDVGHFVDCTSSSSSSWQCL